MGEKAEPKSQGRKDARVQGPSDRGSHTAQTAAVPSTQPAPTSHSSPAEQPRHPQTRLRGLRPGVSRYEAGAARRGESLRALRGPQAQKMAGGPAGKGMQRCHRPHAPKSVALSRSFPDLVAGPTLYSNSSRGLF